MTHSFESGVLEHVKYTGKGPRTRAEKQCCNINPEENVNFLTSFYLFLDQSAKAYLKCITFHEHREDIV